MVRNHAAKERGIDFPVMAYAARHGTLLTTRINAGFVSKKKKMKKKRRA